MPCRQNHPAVINFPAGCVIFHEMHSTALRANGLRGFGGDLGVAMGTFKTGRRRHKLMIFEGLQLGALPAAGEANR
jgi:hypothetical protein